MNKFKFIFSFIFSLTLLTSQFLSGMEDKQDLQESSAKSSNSPVEDQSPHYEDQAQLDIDTENLVQWLETADYKTLAQSFPTLNTQTNLKNLIQTLGNELLAIFSLQKHPLSWCACGFASHQARISYILLFLEATLKAYNPKNYVTTEEKPFVHTEFAESASGGLQTYMNIFGLFLLGYKNIYCNVIGLEEGLQATVEKIQSLFAEKINPKKRKTSKKSKAKKRSIIFKAYTKGASQYLGDQKALKSHSFSMVDPEPDFCFNNDIHFWVHHKVLFRDSNDNLQKPGPIQIAYNQESGLIEYKLPERDNNFSKHNSINISLQDANPEGRKLLDIVVAYPQNPIIVIDHKPERKDLENFKKEIHDLWNESKSLTLDDLKTIFDQEQGAFSAEQSQKIVAQFRLELVKVKFIKKLMHWCSKQKFNMATLIKPFCAIDEDFYHIIEIMKENNNPTIYTLKGKIRRFYQSYYYHHFYGE